MHDPGGKVRIKVNEEIISTVKMSDCKKYRSLLTRKWTGGDKEGFVLWIGMNPSTADATVDDPTVLREQNFTKRWGYSHYVKCNVMDYRATSPKMLLEENVVPCRDENIEEIISQAKNAALVVMAYGSLHKKLFHYGENITKSLLKEGIKLNALKITKNGSPGHPLYLSSDSELMPFRS